MAVCTSGPRDLHPRDLLHRYARKRNFRHLKRVNADLQKAEFMSQQLTLNVNGKDRIVTIAPDTPLLYVLRDHLALHGPEIRLRSR